jgi:hypothetical protein
LAIQTYMTAEVTWSQVRIQLGLVRVEVDGEAGWFSWNQKHPMSCSSKIDERELVES